VEFMIGPLCDKPRRVGHPLQRELAGLWSARRGAYRVVTRSMTRQAPSPCFDSKVAL
jgi:mRNA-degrading endonuclease RelE of RelBE toxin-antitoxin system